MNNEDRKKILQLEGERNTANNALAALKAQRAKPTYSAQYADLTIDRLRYRAVSALDSIIEDAQRFRQSLQSGNLPNRVRTLGPNAQTVIEACAALDVLHEVRDLENASS